MNQAIDRASLEELWTRFHGRLRGFVMSRVGDAAVADDIVQEIFLKVHGALPQLRDDSRIAPWLFQIARNAIYDHFRGNRNEVEIDDSTPAPADESSLFAEQNLAAGLQGLIDELPESYREAIRLTEIDGLTQAEMAARLGLTVSGGKARVQRGRERLRELILDCCHVELDHAGRVVDYWERPVCCDRNSK
jgi:RNA polymerase sigma-70 factor (ECF subfamily)